MSNLIRIAVSKGRVFETMQPLFKQMKIEVVESFEESRKLVLNTENPAVQIVIIRGMDVPTYVSYGAADLGVVGKDILMEYNSGGIYELLDLGIATCRLMVAGCAGAETKSDRIRVATKYENSAREHFARKREQVEVIKLYGSMELAPLVGLADVIVDLVDTGNTLAANGLVEREEIAKISARLIANKAAIKMRHKELASIISSFKTVCLENSRS